MSNTVGAPGARFALSGWKLALALIGAFILGVLGMIAFAFTYPEEDSSYRDEDVVAGTGDRAASRYLDGKGIVIEPETYSKIAGVVCDGMDNGSSGSQLTDDVVAAIGLTRLDASEVVAASAVYSCPQFIGKLAR